MKEKQKFLWCIKHKSKYWLESGGVTTSQREAEKFERREDAEKDLERWGDPNTLQRVVRIRLKKK